MAQNTQTTLLPNHYKVSIRYMYVCIYLSMSVYVCIYILNGVKLSFVCC